MKGIDVSEWQGKIDWNKVKNEVDFVILRLGWIGNRNNHTLDKRFKEYYSECKRLGIPVGIYVYVYSNSVQTVESGARWTLEQLKDKELQLPVYIDMEDSSIKGLGKRILTDMVKSFNNIIESVGLWAGTYANLDWWRNYLIKDELIPRYTSWIAHYGVDKNKYKGQYDMLQYTSSGSVNGINGRVDMNEMYRDLINEINNKADNKVEDNKKSIDELAKEVIEGKWGNTPERKIRLTEAGYDYNKVQERVNELLKVSKEQPKELYYIIQKGDTLYSIAKKYGTSVDKLIELNGIKRPNLIYAGTKIRIK